MKQRKIVSAIGLLVLLAGIFTTLAGCSHKPGYYAGSYEGSFLGPGYIRFVIDNEGRITGTADTGSSSVYAPTGPFSVSGNVNGKGEINGDNLTGTIDDNLVAIGDYHFEGLAYPWAAAKQ